MKVYLTAMLQAKPGSIDLLKSLLDDLVIASNQEQSCIQYELYQDSTDESRFIFHETWDSEAGLTKHNSQLHLQEFIARSEDLIDGHIHVYKTRKLS
jgi:quinol monooxygenase YgiN